MDSDANYLLEPINNLSFEIASHFISYSKHFDKNSCRLYYRFSFNSIIQKEIVSA